MLKSEKAKQRQEKVEEEIEELEMREGELYSDYTEALAESEGKKAGKLKGKLDQIKSKLEELTATSLGLDKLIPKLEKEEHEQDQKTLRKDIEALDQLLIEGCNRLKKAALNGDGELDFKSVIEKVVSLNDKRLEEVKKLDGDNKNRKIKGWRSLVPEPGSSWKPKLAFWIRYNGLEGAKDVFNLNDVHYGKLLNSPFYERFKTPDGIFRIFYPVLTDRERLKAITEHNGQLYFAKLNKDEAKIKKLEDKAKKYRERDWGYEDKAERWVKDEPIEIGN